MRPLPSRRARVLTIAACALSALLSAAGCGNSEKGREAAPPPSAAPHATHAHANRPAPSAEPSAAADAPSPAPPPDQAEQAGKPPSPHHVWVQGYWFWDGKKHEWHKGYWEDETAFATSAPPAIQAEHAGREPGAEYFYMPGYWRWAGKEYVWAPGHWDKPREGMRYTHTTYLEEKGHWVRHGLGWEKEDTAWEKRYADWGRLGEMYVHKGEVAELEKRGEREGWWKAHLPRKHVELAAYNPRKGPKPAKVTMVEFCDFQCPFCAGVQPTLKQLEETYSKDLAIVIKNRPLAMHADAMPAAQAFMAAQRQGKAWPMFDKLFGSNGALGKADLQKYAREIHLDVAKFDKDVDGPEVKEEIDADLKQAGAVGATGTPTFFINGRKVFGAAPLEKFKAIIDDEIKKADELIKAGTPVDEVYKKISESP